MKTGRSLSGPEPVELKIARTLKKKKKTLALAESCTGGLVSHRLTNVPGSSRYFAGSVIAYANSVKISILGVSSEIIKKHGVVSREVACAMAGGARRALNADMAAAITGITGPAGGSVKKPVGLAYMAIAFGKGTRSRKVIFKGDRMALKARFAQAALKMIAENV
jgi:PncC family amidohydrolase